MFYFFRRSHWDGAWR